MKCQTCGEEAHDFRTEEVMDCIPPKEALVFGNTKIDENYRNALFNKFPDYDAQEIVGSYHGKNEHFPSQASWLEEQDEEE